MTSAQMGPANAAVRFVSLEAAVFGGGALGLWATHGARAGTVFAGIVVVHYATTPRRLRYVWSCRGWGQPN